MISRLLPRGPLFACLWWILAEGRLDGWLLGGIAVIAATWASVALWPSPAHGVRLAAVPAFLVFFLANSVRGGWQVALMALRGRRSLQPVFLDLPLSLPAGAPQVLLTNVLGLMPGTLGVELVDELTGARLRLHVLHQDLPVVAEVRALERRIAALFGVAA